MLSLTLCLYGRADKLKVAEVVDVVQPAAVVEPLVTTNGHSNPVPTPALPPMPTLPPTPVPPPKHQCRRPPGPDIHTNHNSSPTFLPNNY